MSFHGPEGAWPRTWTAQQTREHRSDGYAQGAGGYSNHTSHAGAQPGLDGSYYQHGYTGSGAAQYSFSEQGAHRASFAQGTASSNGLYTSQHGYACDQQPVAYASTIPQYSQRSQTWPQSQPSPVAVEGQAIAQSHLYTTPVEYVSSPLPPTAPTTAGAHTSYVPPDTWPCGVPSATNVSSGHNMAVGQATGSSAEYAVPCPYNCGTVLTGVHAVGNMTRHLKSQNCVGSGREKPRHACPVQGCEKRYIRSDGLKVHLRKRHNISQLADRSGVSEYDETRHGYS